MNRTSQQATDLLQDRIGRRMAAHLDAGVNGLSYDISERLRAARVQAVAARKRPILLAQPMVVQGGGSAVLGSEESGWGVWSRLATALPAMALLVGMVLINLVQDDNRATELAEIDVALLTDDLPPAAYADPGFLQFLRRGPAAESASADQ